MDADESPSTAVVTIGQPAPGKQFCTVFPKAGVDTSQTADFIKATVGADDLLPWTDVQENLLSWTVEASEEEVTRLQGHADIDRVTKLELPPQPEKLVRRDPATEEEDNYGIFPKDENNQQQCNQTDASLRSFLKDKFRKPYIYECRVKQVEGIAGVESVVPNSLLEPAFIVPEIPQPSSVAKLSDAVDKRDLSYSTQQNAATELVAISQPSNNGQELQNQLKGCALLPDTWSFSYGLGSDGREWTAKFRTGVFQKNCVGNAVKTAGGFKDFGCGGSG
ncbi:hypothetical protein F5Y06DRAFT_308585 [Hypoxylon sp. FL0890]|nr:hypothetical protein F5Y06DRAFT_308585 [Hypoxylon sp. FL0890]